MRLEDIAKNIRCSVLTMVKEAGVGHIGGSLSVTDILVALYFKVLKVDPENPGWPDRDRLVVSKGHCAAALYSTLAQKGFFSKEELKTFGMINSSLQVHPDKTKVPGIEASTGALGQGLSIGLGMALAARLDKKGYHTFVILGDGEIQEGQVWEAALFAAHYKLDNITSILDLNNVQLMGNVPEIMGIAPVADKWKAFGWEVIEVDGHDFKQFIENLYKAKEVKGKPAIIIANTIKGKGVSFMQNTCKWHGSVPTQDEYNAAIAEIRK
ncbi:MAG: transketolase [Actinobacteria bacterium]|nr:transketolase [Actinomycetota bacterium]MCL6088324.1 transketolase [Actinomycetota bacterium]